MFTTALTKVAMTSVFLPRGLIEYGKKRFMHKKMNKYVHLCSIGGHISPSTLWTDWGNHIEYADSRSVHV